MGDQNEVVEQATAAGTADVVKQVGDSDPSGSDRRRNVRYRVSLPVHIRLTNGDIAKAKAVDISIGGVYVECAAAADNGKVFEMLFDLPFANEFKRVIVKAEVVRSVMIGGKDVYGIAFNFTEFARDTDKVLEKYLEMRALKQAV